MIMVNKGVWSFMSLSACAEIVLFVWFVLVCIVSLFLVSAVTVRFFLETCDDIREFIRDFKSRRDLNK